MRIDATTGPDGQPVLQVSGEVDIQGADELRDAGLDAATESGVAMDLAAVTFIDSSGLAALVAIHNTLSGRGQVLRLRSPSPTVRHIIDVTGLGPVFAVD